MIDWTKIVESHVIRTFRNICFRWWGIDIQFYDAYGASKNNGLSFRNPICKVMNSTSHGVKRCVRTYQRNLKEFKKNQRPFFYECFAGLQGYAVPLIVKKRYVGTMIGSGLCVSENTGSMKKNDMEKLIKLGFDRDEIDRCCGNLKTIDRHTKAQVSDFMELVAEDVTAFYELLQEKKEIINKQSLLLTGIYKEKYKGIIGVSSAMKKVFDTLELIERSESPVLVEGESGTGKELIAAAIHYNSPRKNKIFVIQNCSAFSDTLLNSELFGHEKGSFTGAIAEKKGLFEIADKGTLFLDEIGDMNMEIQAKLLRVLEDGSFYRVGGVEQKKSNVRIIAATNKGLSGLVERGLFRKDLFYRINTIHVILPPLRERKEDILLLIDNFLDYYAISCNGGKKELNQAVRELLQAYHWPGNVRELKNLIERLVLMSGTSKTIEVSHIPREILPAGLSPGSHTHTVTNHDTLANALKALEKTMVSDALQRAQWNKTHASRELGISRASLNNKIMEFDIQPNRDIG